MIESEPNATSDNPPPPSDAPHSVSASLIALLFVAAALVASNWFFYQQGQRDAAVGNSEAVTAATQDAVTPPSDTVAQRAGDSTTMPATTAGATQPAAPGDMPEPTSAADAVDTGTMVVHPPSPAATAKPASQKHRLASSAKPSHSVVVKPENRDVVLLGNPKPTYPRQALREREEGTVLVLAQVDVQGHVSDARVVRRSGSFALDHAATNEVRRWQFQPALRDGQPVVASVQVPVSYRLEQ